MVKKIFNVNMIARYHTQKVADTGEKLILIHDFQDDKDQDKIRQDIWS